MEKKLLIIGASGHGKVVAEIARNNGYTEILFLDDDPTKQDCGGYRVVGTTAAVAKYSDADFIVAIGNAAVRRQVQESLLEQGLSVTVLIHPAAVVAQDVEIGTGTVVMAGAVINPGTRIGAGCIINTCASVDHDNTLTDYVHVSVGAHLAGTVTVGHSTWIGVGAVVSNNLQICGDCMIGAGAVVIESITESGTYVGVPAGRIK